MRYAIIRKDEQPVSAWSGGTTTQIAIFPPNSDYRLRRFDWRLSTATIEVEESAFTNLPGIARWLMVTQGELTLEHAGQHRVMLRPFEQDSFCGDWDTHSAGRATDFNLMTAQGVTGALQAIPVGANTRVVRLDAVVDPGTIVRAPGTGAATVTPGDIWEAFYCVDSAVTITGPAGEPAHLECGDLLLLQRAGASEGGCVTLQSSAGNSGHVIRATIVHPNA